VETWLNPTFNLALDGGSLVKFTCQALYSRKRTPVPIEEKVQWAPETVWTFWKTDENVLPLLGFKPETAQTVA